MEGRLIDVPYGDFIGGIKALADLDNIRAIVSSGGGYCSDAIMAILGLPVDKEAQDGMDR